MTKYLFKDIVLGEEGLLKGPFGSDLKKEFYVPKGENTYKVYLQENILKQDNNVGSHYISKQYFDEKMSRYEVKDNDFIVTCDGTLGEIFQLKNITEKGVISSSLLRITLNPEIVDADYFYYLFKAIIKRALITQGNNSVLKHLPGLNVIRNHLIDLPDLITQRRIGRVLKCIDDKIENNNKINAELESMAKTVYDYWFLQFDFPDENGRPYKSSGGKMVWNEELKREIPEGWEAKRLGDIFNFVKGKIPDELSETKGCGMVDYLTIDAINIGTTQYCNPSSMPLTDGDVLMVMDGAASSEVYVGDKGAIGSTFCKLEIQNEYIQDNFLYVIMKKLEDIFKKVNTGSTVPHANKNYINDFYICLPRDDNTRFELQKDIVLAINTIIHNKKENKELISLRNFLLPLLMNGQVRFMKE